MRWLLHWLPSNRSIFKKENINVYKHLYKTRRKKKIHSTKREFTFHSKMKDALDSAEITKGEIAHIPSPHTHTSPYIGKFILAHIPLDKHCSSWHVFVLIETLYIFHQYKRHSLDTHRQRFDITLSIFIEALFGRKSASNVWCMKCDYVQWNGFHTDCKVASQERQKKECENYIVLPANGTQILLITLSLH